jgi:hypothetical protein
MTIAQKFPIFRRSVYAFLIFMATALIYGQFLWNPIVFDDVQFFLTDDNALKHYLNFSPFELRWLPMSTIAWTAHLFGIELIWFRLEGLLLHAATGITLFFFLQHLFGLVLSKVEDETKALPHVWMAFFASLLFILHPVAVYGAGYLIQRTIVMATLFSLLALYVYMRGLTEQRTGWLWGSVILYYLAVFSKETAVMLPAVMLALTVLLLPPSRTLWKRVGAIYVACALIAVFALFQKVGLMGAVYEIAAPEMLGKTEHGNAYLSSILTQSFLFFKYALLWLLPNPAWMSVDMREPFASGLFSYYLIAALAYIVYGVLGLRLLLKRAESGLLGFSMLFPWLMFFTEFTTVRIQESFVLYRSYLWMAGIFVALPYLLKHVKPRLSFYGLLFCSVVFAMLAVNRLTIFSDSLLLWDDALMLVNGRNDLPGVDRIYFNRGKYLSGIKRYQDALADYQKAAALNPGFFYNHYGLGVGYLNMAQYPQAIVEFSTAIEMEPLLVRGFYGRGLANLEVGNKTAALADFEKSCGLGWKSGCAKAQLLKGEKTSASRALPQSP